MALSSACSLRVWTGQQVEGGGPYSFSLASLTGLGHPIPLFFPALGLGSVPSAPLVRRPVDSDRATPLAFLSLQRDIADCGTSQPPQARQPTSQIKLYIYSGSVSLENPDQHSLLHRRLIAMGEVYTIIALGWWAQRGEGLEEHINKQAVNLEK